jgi:hypothetical protein
MDRVLDLDVLDSPTDVPQQWIQFPDENVVAGRLQIYINNF